MAVTLTCSTPERPGLWACTTATASLSESGIEFGLAPRSSLPMSYIDVDISPSSIRFDVNRSLGSILGLGPATLANLDWMGPAGAITGFTFDTDIPDLDATRLSFAEHAFSADFDGLDISQGQFLDVTLETQVVAEPATALLCAIGLLGVGYARRRRGR